MAQSQALYLVTDPVSRERTLVLATDSLALSIRPRPRSAPSSSTAVGPSVVISLVQRGGADDPVLDGSARRLSRVYGSLGLLQLGQDIFLAVIDASSNVGAPNGRGEVARIDSVLFACLTSAHYDAFAGATSSHHEETYDGIELGGPTAGYSSSGTPILEHPCAGIRKMLSGGSFYLASDWDLSSRLEARLKRTDDPNGEGGPVYDERFLWNHFMIDPLLGFRDALTTSTERAAFDASRFVVLVIQGFVGVAESNIAGARCTLSVISRLGWKRAGTRYLTRGIDDDGEVANFVETETILRTPEMAMSYVQIRGSVPLFWEQQAAGPFAPVKLQLTRPPVASQPAFDKHLDNLLEVYPRVHGVNLLSTKDHEAALSTAYDRHLRSYVASAKVGDRAQLSHFDFHAAVRDVGIENVRDRLRAEGKIRSAIDDFGYALAAVKTDGSMELIASQNGVFRVNCLDCLDRTNVVGDILSRLALESYVLNTNPGFLSAEPIWTGHRNLWASNGDALSKIYAGTGALNTSFTRSGRQTFAGLVSNATKSAARMYAAQVTDKTKQVAIDALLGHSAGQSPVTVFDPVHDRLNDALSSRVAEYSSYSSVTVFAGTWNLNGRAPGAESLLPWLFPDPSVEPDLLVIGFQELVELTANNVLLTTDPEKLRAWESFIQQTLTRRSTSNKASEYVVLRSAQLVGTALIVLAKVGSLPNIRRVEMSQKKTGLKGVAGNKGAVAIRLEYNDSSFCFVTAHFAAGQSNVEERCRDFYTISNELRFQRGKLIDSHDNVVWLGDFNFRVPMAREDVRDALLGGDLDKLLAVDQLQTAMRGGLVFAGYEEGPITFSPTYKYDTMSTEYDTSEKQRVPSWTDRILYRGIDLDLNRYSRAELKNSDHRPVMAVFRARVRTIDQARKEAISAELLASMSGSSGKVGPPSVPVARSASPIARRSRTNGKAAASLPAPSDDQQAWWSNGSAYGRLSTSCSINTERPDDPLLIDLDDDTLAEPASSNPFDRRRPPSPRDRKANLTPIVPVARRTSPPPPTSQPRSPPKLPARANTTPSSAASPVRRKPVPSPVKSVPPLVPPRPASVQSATSSSPPASIGKADGEDEPIPLKPSQLKALKARGGDGDGWATVR